MFPLNAPLLRRSWAFPNVSRLLFAAWTIVVIGRLFDIDPASDPAAPWSAGYWATGALLSAFAWPVSLWWAPRLTYAMAAGVSAWAAQHLVGDAAGLLRWLAVVALVLLAWTLVADLLARPHGPRIVPSSTDGFDEATATGLYSKPWRSRGAVAVVALLAIPAALIWHQYAAAEAATFLARAHVIDGAVAEVDEDGLVTHVRVEGSIRALDAADVEGAGRVGQPVRVLTDGERYELESSPADWSWLVGVAAGLPLVAAAAWTGGPLQVMQRRRLVRRGAASVGVRVVADADGLLVLPVDASWPVLRVREPDATTAVEPWEEPPDDEEDMDLTIGEEEPPTFTSDDELARYADEQWAAWEEVFDHEHGEMLARLPEVDRVLPMLMVGAWRQGASVALVSGDASWVGEVSRPWLPGRARRRIRQVLAGTDAASDGGTLGRSMGPLATLGGWSQWLVVAVPLAALAAWIVAVLAGEDGGLDWLVLVKGGLGYLALAFAFGEWFEGGFLRSRGGVVARGVLLDRVLTPDDVTHVAAGSHLAAIAVRDQWPVLVPPEALKGVRAADPEDAARELRRWLGDARPVRWRVRPTPALACGLAGALIIGAAACGLLL